MSRCVWSAYHLPHTEHGDCAGFLPQLAQDLQRLMDPPRRPPGRPTPDTRTDRGELT